MPYQIFTEESTETEFVPGEKAMTFEQQFARYTVTAEPNW